MPFLLMEMMRNMGKVLVPGKICPLQNFLAHQLNYIFFRSTLNGSIGRKRGSGVRKDSFFARVNSALEGGKSAFGSSFNIFSKPNKPRVGQRRPSRMSHTRLSHSDDQEDGHKASEKRRERLMSQFFRPFYYYYFNFAIASTKTALIPNSTSETTMMTSYRLILITKTIQTILTSNISANTTPQRCHLLQI